MIPALKTNSTTARTPLCPECEVSTAAYRCDGAILFKCGKCHGLWLNAGKKLGVFRRALEKFNYDDFQIQLLSENPNSYVVSTCFRCRQVLDEFNYGYNSGVLLYRCARCQGMWMPLRQMINLMESLRLCQSVNKDVRLLLAEVRKIHGELFKFRSLVQILRSLV